MPRRTKPGVNWAEIEKAVRAGQSTTSLAKEHDVARQSIDKRANKEGWRDGPQKWMPATRQTDTARRLESPQNATDKRIAAYGNRTPENQATILDELTKGVPLSLVAGVIGLGYDAFNDWRKADPVFDRLVYQARQMHLANQYGNIAKASDRGDWKAAQAMLQAAPETKKDWSNNNLGSGGITVNISIWGEDSPPEVAEIIDIEPDE